MTNDPLLQPIRLGELTLPNRVVMTSVKLGYATKSGEVTERHVAFYRRRAKGGPSLIVTEPLWVRADGREVPTQLGIDSDLHIDGLGGLVDSVHEAGGKIAAHINHAGRAANPKLVPEKDRVSASDVMCPANGVVPHPLTRTEIDEMLAAFSAAATRVRQAGFDALELPFSHGYLIHQFLSPHTNRRQDEYGGSFQNRLRFGLEILDAVRREVGTGFPVIVRMNAVDYVEGGITVDDAVEIATALSARGVDALSITSGTMCESVPFCLYPTGTPRAHLLPMAARIRSAVTFPVIVAGRIRSPETARSAIAEKQADLVGLGRPFLSDPDWVRKTANGDEKAILLCAACHQGCLAELRRGYGTGCVFNPLTGRESEVEITQASNPRRVLVVGGGPGGLEAARVAAERGHHVTLYERENQLGGQLHLASLPPHKEGFADVVRHMELMARRAGADIRAATYVTPELVNSMKPDAVVLATGGIPLLVDFPGLDRAAWTLSTDVLDGSVKVGSESALVIGGGLVGLETADFLASQGKRITLVEMLEEVGCHMDPLAKTMITKRLNQYGAELHTNTKVVGLTEDRVFALKEGQQVALPCETVVLAVGVKANRELPEALASSDLEVYVIGDALEPRRALEAVREGFDVGLQL
jgi:2,4-dienoyl-CoA reductase-like NADH-dependent reductase (Old Yellow Enzyme family)/thioredoxin reductase